MFVNKHKAVPDCWPKKFCYPKIWTDSVFCVYGEILFEMNASYREWSPQCIKFNKIGSCLRPEVKVKVGSSFLIKCLKCCQLQDNTIIPLCDMWFRTRLKLLKFWASWLDQTPVRALFQFVASYARDFYNDCIN